MQYGFIRTALASCALKVADVEYNRDNIKNTISNAVKNGVSIIVFPELCITSSTCKDLFNHETLLHAAKAALFDIASFTKGKEILCVAGLPFMHENELYNCAAVIFDGQVIGMVPKSDIKSDEKHFRTAKKVNEYIDFYGSEIPFGTKIIFKNTLMEQMAIGIEIGTDLFLPVSPSSVHAKKGAAIILNPSAIAEDMQMSEYINTLVRAQSKKTVSAYVHVNASAFESTTDSVYSQYKIVAQNGDVLLEQAPFKDEYVEGVIDVSFIADERRKVWHDKQNESDAEYITVLFDMVKKNIEIDFFVQKNPFFTYEKHLMQDRCERILDIQAAGLKKRMIHVNAEKAVIGISGGLDSTLALLAVHKAFAEMRRDIKEILCVSMPCFGTTDRTKNNAQRLCTLLGTDFKEIDISDAVTLHLSDIGHDGVTTDVTYENAQARERTQVLMDIANMTNGMVIGTGNLSEQALGWSTYNGDHMSMYCINTSVPKTLVKHLILHIAQKKDDQLSQVLKDIADTPISPELLPPEDGKISQKTEHIVGPYELHDFYLYHFVRSGFGPDKILVLANAAFKQDYSAEDIKKWLVVFLKRFFSQQFKRNCSPDGPTIGPVSLSPREGFSMVSDAMSAVWLDVDIND